MMQHLINKHHGAVFESFVNNVDAHLRLPPSGNPYECKEKAIKELGMAKRMFWCKGRQYRKQVIDENGWMDGFYCAGSLKTVGRVFAFKPFEKDGRKVSPEGELNNVDIILLRVLRDGGSK